MSPRRPALQRDARRSSFDAVAELYARARLPYPDAAFDAIAEVIPPPARVLEIGPGPGVATLPLAQRGYQVLGVELGANMARVARRRLSAHRAVRIITGDFDTWRPEVPGSFDLVLAASSWHWLDPAVSYRSAHDALRPGGWLALMANHPRPGRPGSAARRFWDAADGVYHSHAPELIAERHWSPRHQPYTGGDIRRSGLFVRVHRLTWRWRHDFTTDAYLALLDTYSDHRALAARRRTALMRAFRSLIDAESEGVAPREYWTHLHLAQRSG